MRHGEILYWSIGQKLPIMRRYHAGGNYWCIAGEAVTREVNAMLKSGLLAPAPGEPRRDPDKVVVTAAGRKFFAEYRVKGASDNRPAGA